MDEFSSIAMERYLTGMAILANFISMGGLQTAFSCIA